MCFQFVVPMCVSNIFLPLFLSLTLSLYFSRTSLLTAFGTTTMRTTTATRLKKVLNYIYTTFGWIAFARGSPSSTSTTTTTTTTPLATWTLCCGFCFLLSSTVRSVGWLCGLDLTVSIYLSVWPTVILSCCIFVASMVCLDASAATRRWKPLAFPQESLWKFISCLSVLAVILTYNDACGTNIAYFYRGTHACI